MTISAAPIPERPGGQAGPARTDWGLVLILSLGFGLVGTDRFLISTMFPIISKDLGLDYADIGIITGALAFSWGLAALILGNKADRIGRRRVLVGSMIAFSLLIGVSGLATGLVGLVFARLLMGVADGAFVPSAVAATLESTEPRHHGRSVGFEQTASTLCGLGIAPLLVAGLLHVVDWRYIFMFVAIPGLVLAWLLWRRLPASIEEKPVTGSSLKDWSCALGYRNVRLAMGLMLCWLTSLIITSAFLPAYLLHHSQLSFNAMSVVMSAIGIGSAVGALTLPALSDRIGRRPVVMMSSVCALVALILMTFAGPNPWLLFALLFVVHACNSTGIALTVGPIATETLPAALMGTASGLVICVGEIVGGGLLPIAAGGLIVRFGIERLLILPSVAMVVALFIAMGLREHVGSSGINADHLGAR